MSHGSRRAKGFEPTPQQQSESKKHKVSEVRCDILKNRKRMCTTHNVVPAAARSLCDAAPARKNKKECAPLTSCCRLQRGARLSKVRFELTPSEEERHLKPPPWTARPSRQFSGWCTGNRGVSPNHIGATAQRPCHGAAGGGKAGPGRGARMRTRARARHRTVGRVRRARLAKTWSFADSSRTHCTEASPIGRSRSVRGQGGPRTGRAQARSRPRAASDRGSGVATAARAHLEFRRLK